VVIVVNALNSAGAGPLASRALAHSFFFDVNGDGTLSAVDALMVINRLNEMSTVARASAARTALVSAADSAAVPSSVVHAAAADRAIAELTDDLEDASIIAVATQPPATGTTAASVAAPTASSARAAAPLTRIGFTARSKSAAAGSVSDLLGEL
jgi:hypothetical protein